MPGAGENAGYGWLRGGRRRSERCGIERGFWIGTKGVDEGGAQMSALQGASEWREGRRREADIRSGHEFSGFGGGNEVRYVDCQRISEDEGDGVGVGGGASVWKFLRWRRRCGC
jgi:hypothetical protein